MDLPLRCACGAWRGVLRAVAPGRGNRCICYCDDCQSFAHYLGRAEEILDAHEAIFETPMLNGMTIRLDGQRFAPK